jgi:hypothetical protein
MTALTIPLLPFKNLSVSEIATEMESLERQHLAFAPWPEFPYKPEAGFVIGHGGDSVYLKFYVTENHVQAVNLLTNSPVHHDSCVEFFLALNDDDNYYNLEFNCSGTCNFGYGPNRHQRSAIPKDLISGVQYQSSFKTAVAGGLSMVSWELTLAIPFTVFSYHRLKTFAGQACRVNFYKCGDLLSAPHYLSWAPIYSNQPNFHLPEFFVNARFSEQIQLCENLIINDNQNYEYGPK